MVASVVELITCRSGGGHANTTKTRVCEDADCATVAPSFSVWCSYNSNNARVVHHNIVTESRDEARVTAPVLLLGPNPRTFAHLVTPSTVGLFDDFMHGGPDVSALYFVQI